MNKIFFFLSLLLLAAVAIFVAINPQTASVNLFWMKKIDTTVAILILCSVALGAILMCLIDLGRHFKLWKEIKTLHAKLKAAEEELKLIRNKPDSNDSSNLK